MYTITYKLHMDNQTTLHDHNFKIFPKVFTREEIDKITATIKNMDVGRKDIVGEWIKARNITIVRLCYDLALRPKEACMIKLGDVDLEKGTITISPYSNKIRQGRVIPIPTQLKPFLQTYLSFSRVQFWKFSDYLFPSLMNNHISRYRFTEIFRDILKKAGLYQYPTRGNHGNYSVYSLRHTKATEVYEKTKDALTVANILGHKTLESTKVYIHLARMKNGHLERMRHALST